MRKLTSLGLLFAVGACATPAKQTADPTGMSFFITSVGTGNGADLGGLAGADAHCQELAAAAGAGDRTWHAYLSTSGVDGKAPVNARDRIGTGPWYNAKNVLAARNVEELHSETNNLSKEVSLNEKGEVVNGRGDTPNRHDMLTGSQPDGTAFVGGTNLTCNDWTSGGRGARSSVTSTVRAAATAPPPGTRRTPPGAAARRTFAPPAATACTTASRSDAGRRRSAREGAGPSPSHVPAAAELWRRHIRRTSQKRKSCRARFQSPGSSTAARRPNHFTGAILPTISAPSNTAKSRRQAELFRSVRSCPLTWS
jgi:hypothetical protein